MTLPEIRAAFPRNQGLLAWLTVGFILIRLGEMFAIAPTWARGYVDDFLCLPLVLSLALMAQRLFGRPLRASLPLSHGLLALGVFAVYFEGALPAAGCGAVADPVDILMYLAGFLVFQLGLNGEVADPPDNADLPRVKFFPVTRTH